VTSNCGASIHQRVPFTASWWGTVPHTRHLLPCRQLRLPCRQLRCTASLGLETAGSNCCSGCGLRALSVLQLLSAPAVCSHRRFLYPDRGRPRTDLVFISIPDLRAPRDCTIFSVNPFSNAQTVLFFSASDAVCPVIETSSLRWTKPHPLGISFPQNLHSLPGGRSASWRRGLIRHLVPETYFRPRSPSLCSCPRR